MPDDTIDFERADLPESHGEAPTCGICGGEIGASYYEIAGRMSCPGCNTRLSAELTQGYSSRAFVRAVLFGSGAAAAGSFVWYMVTKVTGYELALIAIGIGIVVGLAIKKATGGIGGKRYQALAMFLTYSSIVLTYVPGILEELRKPPPAAEVQQGAPPVEGVAPLPSATPAEGPAAAANASSPAVDQGPPPTLGEFLRAWALLLAFCYAAPFLAGFKNIMGILIIGIGLYEAWKYTRGVPIPISGPFTRE